MWHSRPYYRESRPLTCIEWLVLIQIRCVQGYFDDDCDHAGDVFEACTPTKSDGRDGEMVGELRAVIVRS